MNNNKSQIFSAEKVIEKEKELKKHPERNRVKTVNAMGESYDIEVGVLALKRAVDEEKKEKKISKNGGKEN